MSNHVDPQAPRRIVGAMMILLAFMLAGGLIGCGGSSSGAEAADPKPRIDPRTASAEVLLKFYNEYSMRQPQIRPQEFLDLVYAENEKQEKFVRLYKTLIPILELDHACWEACAEGFFPTSQHPPLTPADTRAVFVEQDADRAIAEQPNRDGGMDRIYFVRVGEQWRFSGYTFEYHPQFLGTEFDLDSAERALRYIAAVAPEVTRELTSVEIGGQRVRGVRIANVRHRIADLVMRRFPEVRENPQRLNF